MIPLRDHNASGDTPIVTYSLIALNVLVFIYIFFLPENALDGFINSYALYPNEIVASHGWITFFTSLFIHGSIGHIVGNMMFLHIFGDNLEHILGRVKYVLFYFICGIGASLLQIAGDPSSAIPLIGASGAIAGLMGGYLVLYPLNRVDVLFSTGPFLNSGTIPAFALLGYWFVAQLFHGAGSLAGIESSDVAYLAHVGGFITGFVLIYLNKARLQNS